MENTNMKKNYIAPEMEIVAVEMSQIICTSLPTGGDASTNGVTEADSPEFILLFDE